jgi:hypothetical protein
MRAALDRQAFCRVTLITPRHRVDVALPADVPLAELVPMVRELLGTPQGPTGWRFTRITGAPLPPSATLDRLGVPDGELLRLGPHVPAPAAPVVDDPVETVAARAGSGGPAGPRVRAAVALVASVLAAALLGLAAWDAPGTSRMLALLPAVGAVVACLVAASAAARAADRQARRAASGADPAWPGSGPGTACDDLPGAAGDDGAGEHAGFAAAVAATCAVPLAAAAGWIALPGPPGAGQLLVAAAAAGTVAAVGQVLVRVVAPVLVGAVTTAAALAGLAVARLWLQAEPAALAAGAAALALAAGPAVPRIALRLAGLPQPTVASDAAELVTEDRLDRLCAAELADRTDLARGFLGGLTGAGAVVAAGAAVPIAAAPGWSGPVTALVVLAVVGLRVRGFADVVAARACLVAAVAGAVGVATVLTVDGGTVVRLLAAAAVAAAATAAVVLTGREEPVGGPGTRRAVDLLESALLAASVPLALAVMDVYALVRAL